MEYQVLDDKSYVRLVDKMGSDLSVVNAARVSYNKESKEFGDKDLKLLNFLLREGHTSPLRHAALTFEVYAPLMAARQWYKHVVSSTHIDDQNGWNESSRRYITEDEEFYIPAPNQWRSKPANSKQGSGESLPYLSEDRWNAWVNTDFDYDLFEELTMPDEYGNSWTDDLNEHIGRSLQLYNRALASGLAPEQARLFLPAYAMYVRWRWTVSLQGALHFLDLRLEHDAQWEIREYAKAVAKIVEQCFPETYNAWKNNAA